LPLPAALRSIARIVTAEASTPAAPAFCSRLSAERGLEPIGSAGCYDGVLAFELDSPWTPKLVGSAASDARLDEAIRLIGKRAKATRLLALEPHEALHSVRRTGGVRVLHFFRSGGPFSEYAKREYDVLRGELPVVLERLAGLADGEVASCEVASGKRDILVCTHGARDACCGKFGYGFYVRLRDLAEERPGLPGGAARREGVRVWRTSHLGGHRFAPTLLDLPSGRMFGRLAASDAEAILHGGARLLDRLPAIYRGRCAIPEPAQLVERELWARTGAGFEAAAIEVSAMEERDHWKVEVSVGAPGAGLSLSARVARVEVEAVVTPASCGRDPEPEAPWRIVE
jgi:hypothetical protein